MDIERQLICHVKFEVHNIGLIVITNLFWVDSSEDIVDIQEVMLKGKQLSLVTVETHANSQKSLTHVLHFKTLLLLIMLVFLYLDSCELVIRQS